MKTIYKYPIKNYPGTSIININKEHQILKLGYDPNGILCVWAIVNPDSEKVEITIDLIGTGWPLEDNFFIESFYIDTINDGPYVWHAFIVPRAWHNFDKEVLKDEN